MPSPEDLSMRWNSREESAGNGAEPELGISIPVSSTWPSRMETNVFLGVYLFFYFQNTFFLL